MALRVMLVEDEARVRASIAETLEEEGHLVVPVESAEAALNRVEANPPDLILSDIRMPGLSGLELLEALRERAPEIDIVLMTAYDDMPTVASAMKNGAADFLVKPLKLEQLRKTLVRIEEDRMVRTRAPVNGKPTSEASTDTGETLRKKLVGRHPAMLEVYKLIGRISSGRVNALIRGETGTGKELIARAIHDGSAYAAEPFVAVNCAALPETLLESELFGHRKGAFTGAVADRKGRFELAGRGTIFLDEIGDTSPALQAKLLRVLEDGIFFPVGAEMPRQTNARVLAATHQNLEEMARTGGFRRDLYFRLRVLEVWIPPLRKRMSDLSLLAKHLLERAAKKTEQPESVLSKQAEHYLVRHSWPGNVRELDNCLTRALVMANGGVIRPEHLDLFPAPGPAPESEPGEFPTFAQVERSHVQQALLLAEGNKTKAAELMAISKPRLYRMLKRHGLE